MANRGIFVLGLTVLLSGACVSHASWRTPLDAGARPSVVEAKATEVVVYDGTTSDPRVKTTVDKAEGAKVLTLLFPKFLSDEKKCPGNPPTLKDARDRGQFVPRVTEVATGAFTEPRSTQKLYNVFVGECGATHADNYGTALLVVVQADAVVARVEAGGGDSIAKLFDIDGDGKNEFLVTSSFTGQGSVTVEAVLSRFEGSRLSDVASFGEVLSGNCAGPFEPKEEEVTTVTAVVLPGKSPTFRSAKKKRPCE